MLITPSKLEFNPPVIGHRGACGYAPENTMASFVKAIQMGVKWIEFDCMLTGSGEVVIIHDEQLQRTTNEVGYVKDFQLGQLLSIDAGAWFAPIFSGEKIPTFLQILEFLHDTGISANIELKPQAGLEEKLVDTVLQEIQRRPFFKIDSSKLLFSSFSLPTMRCLRKKAPNAQMGLLLHEWMDNWEALVNELRVVSIHVNQEILDRATCHVLKKSQTSLLAYTVNDPARAMQLFKYGTDAVFSDYPDVIIEQLNTV